MWGTNIDRFAMPVFFQVWTLITGLNHWGYEVVGAGSGDAP